MLSSVCGRIQLFIVLIVGETARPPNASVYLISPKDGDTVTGPFRVQLASLASVLRPPASTRRTQVTTIS